MHLKNFSTIRIWKAQYKSAVQKTENIFSCPQEPKAQYNTILTFPNIPFETIWNINHFICTITCRFSNLLVIIFVISKVQLIQFKKQAEVTWQIVTAKLKSVKPPYYRISYINRTIDKKSFQSKLNKFHTKIKRQNVQVSSKLGDLSPFGPKTKKYPFFIKKSKMPQKSKFSTFFLSLGSRLLSNLLDFSS